MESLVKFINIILKMGFYSSVSFYTTWGIFLLFLYVLGILKKYQSSIFVILLTIFYIGNIITYVFPRVIVIPYIKRKISGKVLKIFNLIFHVLPLVLFLILYDTRIKQDKLYLAVFSLLIYLVCFNPINVYNYKCKNCKEKKVANSLVIIYIVIIALLIMKQKNLF
jgi:hypothetical protein|tara:strand:- start:84 stop:581 length:498 start_codon:yes stop_codon:yes gene_type:complete